MANFLGQTAVSVAAKPFHNFPMHPMHLTTGKFMHFEVAFAKEFPKHKNKKIKHKSFVRCMPMKKPLLSSIQFHKSAYYVPFRTVWEPYSDFKEDVPHVQQEGAAILEHVPLLSNNVVVDYILRYSDEVREAGAAYDFNCPTPGDDNQVLSLHYKMQPKARDAFKLLRSLGYGVYFNSYDPDKQNDETQSALPLLCAAKVYLDHYFPNQYAHSGYYINLDGIFNRQYIYTLDFQDLESIFEVCRFVAYQSDYFTAAFDSPLGPSAGVVSTDYVLNDISIFGLGQDASSSPSGSRLKIVQEGENVPMVEQTVSTTTQVMSQYMDNALKALDNYIRRHGLAGSRALERYLADWGVALSADKLRRCYKLTEKHYPLQVSDIMSSADTIQEVAGEVVGAALGDYAGKGVAFNGDCEFDCVSDEFGYLLVINTIVPEPSYYQGVDPNVLHKTRLDFLTGDFDGLGTRPIRSQELFVGMKRESSDYDGIFGFTPIYSEYKCCPDRVSGDFLLDTLNVGLEGFSTVREWSDKDTDDPFDEVHGFNFVLGNDWEQYNRIFANSEDGSDKFVIVHRCDMEPSMPAVPMFDYYDFQDGKDKIKLDVNGTNSN